ncbi:MAG: hypothetical protein ABFD65_07800 [Candidatus Polarisedimenticolia bacterium]
MAYASLALLPASTVLTSSGAGTWQPVPAASMIAVGVDITAASGTLTLDLWLQGTNDPTDATGFDVPADQVVKSAPGSGTAGTVAINTRDVVDAKTTTTAERFYGLYRHFPFNYVREAHTLAGTNPSDTLGVTAGVK